MLEINWAAMGVIVALLGALFTLAYNAGSQNRQIKTNREDIRTIFDVIDEFKKDNKKDHQIITDRLDMIIKNGKRK